MRRNILQTTKKLKMQIEKINGIGRAALNNEVARISKEVEEGNLDPLEVHIKAKYLIALATEVVKNTLGYALGEAEKFKDQGGPVPGVKLSVRSGSVRLNYQGDIEYAHLHAELKRRENLLKEAYKADQNGGLYIDKETNEVVEPPKIKSVDKDSVSVTFV